MFADIVIEFENVTKYSLLQYFKDYRDFMQNDFSYISDYYAGNTESVDSSHISIMKSLIERSKTLIQQFINFQNKLSNCGFWELQEYCQDLSDVLDKITNLPRYNRTSLSVRGYQPYIKAVGEIGGMKTIQDLAQDINSSDINETNLILENDLSETDWEIDKLSTINALVNNQKDVVVETIIEEPSGNKVYGKDISRKISIIDNDLNIEKYEDNVSQKCDILLELNKGDIPELPNFGKNLSPGTNVSNYNLVELIKDVQSVFNEDDLFDSVEISEIGFNEGSINVSCTIKTKYSYSTDKIIKIW